MAKSRMFGGDDPGNAENASPRTTIVGGRPPETPGSTPPVPMGIQTLLHRAAEDPSFRDELIARRVAAADAAGITLTASERAILAAAPDSQILGMVAQVQASPRRRFLQQMAAAGTALLGGSALANCEPHPASTPPRPEVNEMQRTGGIAPSQPPFQPLEMPQPPPRPDMPPPPPAGIQPDIPPPPPVPPSPPPRDTQIQVVAGVRPMDLTPPVRPVQSHPTRGIRPRPPGDNDDDL